LRIDTHEETHVSSPYFIIIRIQSHNTKEKQMYCAAQDQEYHSQLRALGPYRLTPFHSIAFSSW